MFSHIFNLRVRYGDTDQMGYVYYGNYGYYYEQARSEAIRAAGLPYKKLEEAGVMMPITRMNIKYIKPALYDDLLSIHTFVPEIPGKMVVFHYKIYNEANELLNVGETHLIFVDAVTRKMIYAPEILLEKIRGFYTDK
jgi:acyl-CoA thioester hydrolase